MKIFVGFIQWLASTVFILIIIKTMNHIQGIDNTITFIRCISIIVSTLLGFCISYKMWFEPFQNEFFDSITQQPLHGSEQRSSPKLPSFEDVHNSMRCEPNDLSIDVARDCYETIKKLGNFA